MSIGVGDQIAPVFPDGFPRGRRLAPLLHSGVRDVRHGGPMRRGVTRDDPLLFALLYLSPFLKDEGSGVISVSQLHLDICDRGARWVEPVRDRSAWASHRDAGKSVWWFLVLPLWCLAHGHRTFYLALSHTKDQAVGHLQTLRRVIDAGGLLLADFPHLAPSKGTGARNTAHWVTSGGVTFSAAGMGETILGRRQDELRPNLIVGDDLDPGEEDFTPASKAKTLGRIVGDVLPMGSRRAAVALTGTPTAAGSMMHDVVRAVRGLPGALADRGEWVRTEGFAPHWHPALIDEGTPRERSAWETHWPTAELQEKRALNPRTFALQYQCDPDAKAAQQWWTDDVFRFDTRFHADARILSIDGAVTSNRTDVDHTALALVAVSPGPMAGRKVCVEHAAAGSWSRVETKRRIWELCERYPTTLRTLVIETNQGGELWAETLGPFPAGVEIVTFAAGGSSKRHRAESLFDDYARGAVWHAGILTALQAQMTAWKPGRGGHAVDDLIDAVGAAERHALYGHPNKTPTPRVTRHGIVLGPEAQNFPTRRTK